MRYVLVGILLLVLFTCRSGSRSSPVGPDIPNIPSRDGLLTVRMARMPQQPVPNAAVTVSDGSLYWTDEDGRVMLPGRYNGTELEVVEHGFLGPRRLIHMPDTVDYLLPDDEQLPSSWLLTAYYPENDSSLMRPHEGQISVELSSELARDPLMPAAVQKAIEHLNAAQPYVQYYLVASGGIVKMELAPDDPIFSKDKYQDAWAVITGTTKNGYVVRSRVVWKFVTRPEHHDLDAAFLWQAAAHELGHHTGIWGHPPGGIMNEHPVTNLDYTPREKEALNYLFLRLPGTRKPDDSTRSVSTPDMLRTQHTDAVGTVIIGCRHR